MRLATNQSHRPIGTRYSVVLLGLGLALSSASVSIAGSDRDAMKDRLASTATVYAITEQDRAIDDLAGRDSIGLYDLLQIAAMRNPGVEAAFNRWKAATEGIAQAGAPPDPRFTYGHFFESVETRVGPQKDRYSLAQSFPWFGTLGLKSDMATQNALMAEQKFAAAQDRLYASVARAYAEYYFLGRSIANTDHNLSLVKNAVGVAETKYRAGTGSYSSLVRGQVELGKLENALLSLHDKSRVVIARLNTLLNRPSDAPMPPPADIPQETLALSDNELMATARTDNPSLNALHFEFQRESLAARLAGRKFYPDFTLGVDYVSTGPARMPGVADSGKDPIMGMFSINIPFWWGAKRAGQKEAYARRRAVELEHRNRENQLLADIQQALFAYHDAERKIALYHDALLPKARESVAVTLKSYEAGEVGFLDAIDAQRVLLDFETASDRARADRLIHLAELRELAGTATPGTTGE